MAINSIAYQLTAKLELIIGHLGSSMILPENTLKRLINNWIIDWNDHDLNKVMLLFHDDAQFISWKGQKFTGKRSIRRAWIDWFKNHGNFHFTINNNLINTRQQTAVIEWELTEQIQKTETLTPPKKIRCGVDILQFKNGLLISKRSYCQTVLLTIES